MNLHKTLSTILFTILFLGVATFDQYVMGQSAATIPQTEKQESEADLDIQLYLLVASNGDIDGAKLPAALDSVVRQLRGALPFKNYLLSATLITRVKDNGRLSLKWVGGPLVTSGVVSDTTPSFNEFKINNVKLVRNAADQKVVRLEGFGFGVRIPVFTPAAAGSSGQVSQIMNYESTGLNTDINVREGEPVVIGTLNIGPSGNALILVMSAKSTNR